MHPRVTTISFLSSISGAGHVGAEHPERFAFGQEHTRMIQRMLAERCHRWIFAREPIATVAQDRPRIVDAERFRAEDQFWADWDDAKRKAHADD